jgi:hypothetical protein
MTGCHVVWQVGTNVLGYSVLKIEAVDSSEIAVTIYLSMQCHASEDYNLLTVQSNPHPHKFV